MKKNNKILGIIAVAAVILISLFFYFQFERSRSSKVIKVSGNIEGDEVRISFRVDGQIEQLLTDEGMVIREGDIVAKLKTDELSKVKANAEASLRAAEYQYALSKIDNERAEKLYQAGSISAQKRDSAKTQADADKANEDQQRASLELANTRLGFADLASPLNGYVLVKSSLEGEVIQPGTPVFTAVDLGNIWVTAYINETDIGKIKLGQKAIVETDSYRGKKYAGRISFISGQAEFTPKYIQTSEERVKYVYRIKVKVDNSSLDLKPGMPADAYIAVE